MSVLAFSFFLLQVRSHFLFMFFLDPKQGGRNVAFGLTPTDAGTGVHNSNSKASSPRTRNGNGNGNKNGNGNGSFVHESYSMDSGDEKEAEKEAEKEVLTHTTPPRKKNTENRNRMDGTYVRTPPTPSFSSSTIAKKVLQAVCTENLEFQTDRSLFNR